MHRSRLECTNAALACEAANVTAFFCACGSSRSSITSSSMRSLLLCSAHSTTLHAHCEWRTWHLVLGIWDTYMHARATALGVRGALSGHSLRLTTTTMTIAAAAADSGVVERTRRCRVDGGTAPCWLCLCLRLRCGFCFYCGDCCCCYPCRHCRCCCRRHHCP